MACFVVKLQLQIFAKTRNGKKHDKLFFLISDEDFAVLDMEDRFYYVSNKN